jgi:hypothetical protein
MLWQILFSHARVTLSGIHDFYEFQSGQFANPSKKGVVHSFLKIKGEGLEKHIILDAANRSITSLCQEK